MRRLRTTIALVAAATPSTALACSCGYPEELTAAQRRFMMRDLSVVGYGRVVAVDRPAACRVAPVRWWNAALARRVPVTYKLRLRRVIWGRSPRIVDVVQHQQATWSSCEPLGSAACEPHLPRGDALWVLRRTPEGEQRYAGRCGIILAAYMLRLDPRTGARAR